LSRRRTGPGAGQIAIRQGDLYTAGTAGVWRVGGERVGEVTGFGLAAVEGALWAAGYAPGSLVRLTDGKSVQLPPGLHPFWLAAGANGRLLAAAEGDREDGDPGAVVSLQPPTYAPEILIRTTDPDEVVESGGRVFVAAHGAREVDVISATGARTGWAKGASAVAIAVDEPLKSLLVVADERE
jgi:hypothetical protein